ncbi:MAG: hypothetical protein UT53_C0030G0004 [Candidatus Yanofskybacteria bacterium GW2011_GWD2_39_48]|uniref:Uncharacterized protein n=1 Tax=Candidatus Yanofskybacteria bacterium GW2011_GWD2_39_48 TaxID=1619031 RepID=A0A0G0SBB5_9BACT|nr:MAG: hypothetical protein UT53_C0030G0004 [Candidatus Yanofskybacteria bacterium GW2011_GWD2_39_48]
MCLDDESYDLLEKINLDNMLLVSMTELEDSELLAVKNEASRFYLGTLKPPFIKYVLDKNPEIDMVVYLDDFPLRLNFTKTSDRTHLLIY